MQDGPKERLLCSECEQIFSAWEKLFAEGVFFPLHHNEPGSYEYREWAMRFAVSVVWRVLVMGPADRLSHFSDAQLEQANRAEAVWRKFLVGARPHPGSNEVHLIPLDVFGQHSLPNVSAFMNRYLLRAVDIDVVSGRSDALVYAKLCRVLIIGFIDVAAPRKWRGGRLHVRHGQVGGPVVYELPENIFHFMNEKAGVGAQALANLSETQKERLHSALESDIDRVARSEVFRAMSADVASSGQEAFRVTGDASQTPAEPVGDG